jgi:Predicted archaeal sugar kinases
MTALPALAEGDIARFGSAITEMQRIMGDYFAPAQGARFLSPRVTEALAWLEANDASGVGQSSWGPTGFALLGSAAEAERLWRGCRRAGPPARASPSPSVAAATGAARSNARTPIAHPPTSPLLISLKA